MFLIHLVKVYRLKNCNRSQDRDISNSNKAQDLDCYEDVGNLSDTNLEVVSLVNMEVVSLEEDNIDTNERMDVLKTNKNWDNIPDLPEEVWCHILTFLSASDKANISLVSRNMYTAVSIPSLWKYAFISKDKLDIEGVAPVLKIYRFALLKNLDLSGLIIEIRDWSALFSHVIQGKPMALETLNLRFVSSLADFPGDMIGKAVAKLRKVHLGNQPLSTRQLTAILNHSLKSSTLDSISLVGVINLSKVDAKLLGKALGRLLSVDLSAAYITKTQCLELFSNSLQCKTLAFLSLGEVDLSDLNKTEAELMTTAVSEIAEVDFWHTGTYRAYPSKLSFDIFNQSSLLTCIDLQACNLSEVDSQVLSQFVAHLKWANLQGTDLSKEQTKYIFSACQESETLKYLSIGGNDLSKVKPSAMTQVGVKMKMLNINEAQITRKQTKSLLNGISGSSLKRISIEGNDLSGLSLNSMWALAGLKVVNLERTNLNKEQTRAILTFIVETGCSTIVGLFENKLPKDKKLRVRARKMDNILLHESSYISTDMCMLRSTKVPKYW